LLRLRTKSRKALPKSFRLLTTSLKNKQSTVPRKAKKKQKSPNSQNLNLPNHLQTNNLPPKPSRHLLTALQAPRPNSLRTTGLSLYQAKGPSSNPSNPVKNPFIKAFQK
jgi:hypothetical protein